MSRVRRGTQALKGGKVMIKSNSGHGARKIRCTGCKQLVAPTMDGEGKPVYKCRCGRGFRSVSL